MNKIVFIILAGFLYIAVFAKNNSRIIPNQVINNFKDKKIERPEADPNKITTVTSTEKYYLVTRVVDGDTIEIETGQKVRYIGIDTPESVHPNKAVQCFGQEASNKNKELVLNKKIRLEKDISETDKYGRLLRYIYLEDGTFVNLQLVKDGYATVATFPPDVKFSQLFLGAQTEAREAERGLWSACR